MTDEQRIKGFIDYMKAGEEQFGVTVVAKTTDERLGDAVLIKPQIMMQVVTGWIPPPEEDKPDA